MTTTARDQRISLQDAALILGCSVDSVRRYIAKGSLPAERLEGRLIRVRKADVEGLLSPVPVTEQDA